MAVTASQTNQVSTDAAWQGFQPGLWQTDIDVRVGNAPPARRSRSAA